MRERGRIREAVKDGLIAGDASKSRAGDIFSDDSNRKNRQ
jgi:hypothetical protein